MESNTLSSELDRVPERRLWYGFTAAPAAWVLQELLGVIVSAQLCPANLPNWGAIGENGVRLLLGLITAILFVVAISAGIVAFENWRALSGHRSVVHAEGSSRKAFMSVGGILISSSFAVGLLWSGIPLIMLQQCMRAQ